MGFSPCDCGRKIVDVAPVAALSDAVAHAGVATQTVGVFPDARKTEVRDALACAGVQRVVSLAHALGQRRVTRRTTTPRRPGRPIRTNRMSRPGRVAGVGYGVTWLPPNVTTRRPSEAKDHFRAPA
nr:acyl-CoA reductase [Streptomyces sp. NL15-2K]